MAKKKLYDTVNKTTVTTTPIPGETSTFSTDVGTLSTDIGNRKRTGAFRGEVNARFIDKKDASAYDENIPMHQDLNEGRAEQQSELLKGFNAIVGGAFSGVGVFMEDVGYVFDLAEHFDRATGKTVDGDNWFSNWGKIVKEGVANTMPIYEKALAEDASTWDMLTRWNTVKGISESMTGYGFAGGAFGLVAKGVGSLVRLNKIAKTYAMLNPKLAKGLTNVGASGMSNLGEGKTMALELYEQKMEEFKPYVDSGQMTQEDAMRRAGDAADKFQKWNTLMLVSDYMGIKGITSAMRGTATGVKSAYYAGTTMVREGLEETYQITQQKLASNEANRLLDKDYNLLSEKDKGRKINPDLRDNILLGINTDLNDNNPQAKYEKEFSEYYNTEQGLKEADQIRKKTEGRDDEFFWDELHANFEKNAQFGLNSSPDNIIKQVINSLKDPQTQTEGLMGAISGPIQWRITRGISYKSELKKEVEKYKQEQDFIKKSKDVIQNDINSLKSITELNNKVISSSLGITQEQATKPSTDLMDGAETQEGEPNKTSDALLRNKWAKMAVSSIQNGTDRQIRSFLQAGTESDNKSDAAHAKKLLDDFDRIVDLNNKNKNYLNSGTIINDEIALMGLRDVKEAVSERDDVSDSIKSRLDDEIQSYETKLKEEKSFKTQKEIVKAISAGQAIQRKIKIAKIKRNIRNLFNFKSSDKISDEDKRDIDETIDKDSDQNIKRKGNTDSVKVDNHNKTDNIEKSRADRIKRKESSARIAPLLDEAEAKIEVTQKRLNKRLEVYNKPGGEKSATLKAKIEEDQNAINIEKNKIAASIEIAELLKEYPEDQFEEQFNKILNYKLETNSDITPKDILEKINKVKKVKKASETGFGENAKKVKSKNEKKDITEIVLNKKEIPIKAVEKGSGNVVDGTIKKGKSKKGHDVYIVTVGGKSDRLIEENLKDGQLSITKDNELSYTFTLQPSAKTAYEITISQGEVLDNLLIELTQAIDKDNVKETKVDEVKSEDKVEDKNTEEGSKKIEKLNDIIPSSVQESMDAMLKTVLDKTSNMTLEFAKLLNRYRKQLSSDVEYEYALNYLDGLYSTIKIKLSNEINILGLDNTDKAKLLYEYLDDLKGDVIEVFKFLEKTKENGNSIHKTIDLEIGLGIINKGVTGNKYQKLGIELKFSIKQLLNDPERAVTDVMIDLERSEFKDKITTESELIQAIAEAVDDETLRILSDNYDAFMDAVVDLFPNIKRDAGSYDRALDLEDTTKLKENELPEKKEEITIDELDEELEDVAKESDKNDETKSESIIKKAYNFTKKIINAFNVVESSSDYKIKGRLNDRGDSIEYDSYEDFKDSELWSMSIHKSVKVGDDVELSIDEEYDKEIYYDNEKMSYSEFLEKYSKIKHVIDEYLPIKITKNGEVIGHLKMPNEVSSRHIAGDTQYNLSMLNSIRKYIMENKSVKTKITKKGNGILNKSKKKVNTLKALGPEVKVFISLNSNNLKRGNDTKQVKPTTRELRPSGRPFIELPRTSTHNSYMSIDTNILSEQQINTVLTAITIFKNRDITHPLYLKNKDKNNQDITTVKGLSQFLDKYINLYKPKAKTKAGRDAELAYEYERASLNKPKNGFYAIDSTGLFYGMEFLTDPNTKKFIKVNAAKLDRQKYLAYEIDNTGNVVDVNNGDSYEMFIKKNSTTNVLGVENINEKGQSEWAYSIKNIIEFDTSFTETPKKPTKKKTKEKEKPAETSEKPIEEEIIDDFDKLLDDEMEQNSWFGVDSLDKPSTDYIASEEIKKKCNTGLNIKAAKGIRPTKFTKGSQWSIVKDLKGHPSHAKGGVDVKIGPDGVSLKAKGGRIKAEYGLLIPAVDGGNTPPETTPTPEPPTTEEEYTPPTDIAAKVDLPELTVEAKAPYWMEDFEDIDKTRRVYKNESLKKTHPDREALIQTGIDREHKTKLSNSATTKIFKKNPRKEGESMKGWLDRLSEGERQQVMKSQYASQFEDGIWDKFGRGMDALEVAQRTGSIPGAEALDILALLDYTTNIVKAGRNAVEGNAGEYNFSDYIKGITPGASENMLQDMALDPANLIGEGILAGAFKGLKSAKKVKLADKIIDTKQAVSKGTTKELKGFDVNPKITTKEPWKLEELPGLHLKSTMENNPKGLHKQVSKDGTINVETALNFIKKESGGEAKVEMIKKGLGDKIPKKMDYNDFRKVVQDQIIPLEQDVARHSSTYGLDDIGYGDNDDLIENRTLVLSNKHKLGRGSASHHNPEETLGHAHFLRSKENPDVLTVTQIQSDAFQGTNRTMPKSMDKEKELRSLEMMERQAKVNEDLYKNAVQLPDGTWKYDKFIVSDHFHKQGPGNQRQLNEMKKAEIENFAQKQMLDKSHQERYLQEIVDFASKRDDELGQINKVRVPTMETAAKVQGYNKIPLYDSGDQMIQLRQNMVDAVESGDDGALEIAERMYNDAIYYNMEKYNEAIEKMASLRRQKRNLKTSELSATGDDLVEVKKAQKKVDDDIAALEKTNPLGYSKEHQTILKKYRDQPKTIKKLFGKEPTLVTDSKGNTWYEFDIPKKFKEGKGEIKAYSTAIPVAGAAAAAAANKNNTK